MTKDLFDTTKGQKMGTKLQKNANTSTNHWASDDVHRVAMRRPSLYQTKTVPQVSSNISFLNIDGGSLA